VSIVIPLTLGFYRADRKATFCLTSNAMKDGNKLHVQIFVLAWSKTFREKSFSTTSVLRARPSIVGECEL